MIETLAMLFWAFVVLVFAILIGLALLVGRALVRHWKD